MPSLFKASLLLTLTLLVGCTINHPIDQDYGQYLQNNIGESQLPRVAQPAHYLIAPSTQNHHYEFRAMTVGYAHLWIVDFGKILDTTLQSHDVQVAFGSLAKANNDATPSLSFELKDYRFADYRAYVSLNVTVNTANQAPVTKTYHSEGTSQGGKMFLAGPFGMKNAVQQSTKAAMDDILRQLLNDYQSQLASR